MNAQPRSFWKALGPGLIFAAAAVGVSHLVQSTRAGAVYGIAMLGFILLANLAKYPAFRFGPHYAAATGTSLLEGYRRQGKWALVLYALVTLGTMFTVQAAVTVVTAGLAKALFAPSMSPITISAGLLVVCAALLAVGRYRLLDRLVKVLVAIFTVSTFVATALVIPKIPWGEMSFWIGPGEMDTATVLFLAALVGWMPSAVDIAVWNSLWTLAKSRDEGQDPNLDDALLDFHIGYIGTVILAICFMLLGAGVMYTSGAQFEGSAGGFAAQIISLYKATLGEWAGPIIGVCALAVMFSTTLTVLDGFPRAIATLVERFGSEEKPDDAEERRESRRIYWIAIAVQSAGSIVVLYFLLTSLKTMVDIATTLSFLTAPILAGLNHRAMFQDNVPESARPRPWLKALSLAGIVGLSLFAAYYVYLKLS